MRFLVDESTDVGVVHFLTRLGHDTTFVPRDYRPGMSDEFILATALAEGRILVTDDRDFGTLVFHRGQPHGGVLYLRLPADVAVRCGRILAVLRTHGEELHRFVVITSRGVRVR